MDNTRALRLSAAALTFLVALLSATVSAQTVRINCGVNNDGVRLYMDVFEFDYVNEKPEFPGGDSGFLNFVNHQRRYPSRAYKDGIQGRVICSFVVNTDGSVSHIEVLKGVESSLNSEAVRILSEMPEWRPGRLEGKAVPVRVIKPIPFRR